VGRGAPLSRGGLAFLRFAADLGFTGLQFGPQGETTPGDPSPYDSTLFGRSTASISLGALVRKEALPAEVLERAAMGRPSGALERAAHAYAHAAVEGALDAAWERMRADPAVQDRLRAFVARNARWLVPAGLYEALRREHGTGDWQRWPERDRLLPNAADAVRRAEIEAASAETIARYRFGQLVAHEQHQAFRSETHRLGLRLSGDLQIGIPQRDLWTWQGLLLRELRMGAPPSRTNPEGQPWGYGVLDPDRYGSPPAPGAALAFVRARADKLLDEFDGMRVDHPHGLIDPWVYDALAPDPREAVQDGARLFSSPERAPFSRWAIARPEQIDFAEARHADRRVRELSEAQVQRYAVLFDALADAAVERGLRPDSLIVEVLSTQPYPVQRVLERHGIGRFRVTQKASMTDPRDVYRAENALAHDWAMVGTHDTEPVWRVADRWVGSGAAPERARYLASRMVADDGERARFAERIAASANALARAQLADLFVGPAQNVMIFFPDLLGMREVYNRPGTVSEENWSLRVAPRFQAQYARAAAEGAALDLPAALAAAMRARGAQLASAHRELLDRLDEITARRQ
jgi:4-alpha-glucanotransferase